LKRIVTLLTVLMMLLGCAQAAFANESGQIQLTDSQNGKTKTYRTVNLLMGGKDVISDVPAILFDLNGKSRTLVPLRFITDNLGAQVAWDNDKKEATIQLQNHTIVLTSDSAEATVDGKPYTLPDKVPVKLLGVDYNYRTMVPIRFVSEQLGLDVGWINNTQTVTVDRPLQSVNAVRYNGNANHPEVVFQTTGEVEAASYFLKASQVGGQDSIIIDLPNTKLDITDKTQYTPDGHSRLGIYAAGLRSVEGQQVQDGSYHTRFTVYVDKKMGYDVSYVPQSKEIHVVFKNSVNSIDTDKLYNVQTVIVHTAEEPTYNVKFQGTQVLVDFINTKLKINGGQAGTVPIGKGGIDSVTYAPQSPGTEYDAGDTISRVTVNLQSGMRAEDVYIEAIDSDLYVYAAGNPLQGFDYAREGLDSSHLNIAFTEAAKYKSSYNKTSRLLTLTIPKTVAALSAMDMDMQDSIVDKLSVAESGSNFIIKAQLAKGTTYVDNSSGANGVNLLFVNDALNNTNFSSKIIVLDAGHGGKDTGARSPYDGVNEKDLALKLIQKLKRKLEGAGFKVVLTREDDTYVGLYDRANIANSLNASAFLSIHLNSNTSAKPYGVEMLYVPDSSRDNAGFASILESEVCKATGANKRGTVQRPELVVIRETKMPAVLSELGFLSNANEEQLLLNEDYQDKLIQGLFNAITKYLK